MMTFVVTYDDEDGDRIFGVFSTRKHAMDHVAFFKKRGYAENGTFHIREHQLDYADLMGFDECDDSDFPLF